MAVTKLKTTKQNNPGGYRVINSVPPRFTIDVMLVTPPMASEWLSNLSEHQRNQKPSFIKTLRAYMQRNEFVFTGDPMRFDVNGKFIDGQHRAACLVAEDVAAWCVIERELPEDVYGYLDQGAVRRFADLVKGNSILSGAVGYLFTTNYYGRIVGHHGGGNVKATNHELAELLKDNPDMLDSAHKVNTQWRIGVRAIGFSMPVCAFLHFLFAKIDTVEAEVFFDDLAEGANLRSDDPVLVLRNRLLSQKERANGTNMHRWHSQALAIKAWNARREGRAVKLLRYNDSETYPQPV